MCRARPVVYTRAIKSRLGHPPSPSSMVGQRQDTIEGSNPNCSPLGNQSTARKLCTRARTCRSAYTQLLHKSRPQGMFQQGRTFPRSCLSLERHTPHSNVKKSAPASTDCALLRCCSASLSVDKQTTTIWLKYVRTGTRDHASQITDRNRVIGRPQNTRAVKWTALAAGGLNGGENWIAPLTESN